jgi:hypothetical protein
MIYSTGLPIIQKMIIARERVISNGTGSVTVAVGDYVEPEQIIVQGAIPEQNVQAGLRGKSVRLIPERGIILEGLAIVIRGLFGIGRPVVGPLAIFPLAGTGPVPALLPGTILIVPGALSMDMIHKASANQASAIFAASAPPTVLDEYVGCDCTKIIDGSSKINRDLPVSLILAHGCANHSLIPEVWQMLSNSLESIALFLPSPNKTGSAGAELILSLPNAQQILPSTRTLVTPGNIVYISGGEYDGQQGELTRILQHVLNLSSGIRAHVGRIKIANGPEVMIPLANLRRIG